jgi:class 3 adenylate cyclase/predicted ATPase
MFVDLVGSTALASRLDPEEMSDLIRTYYATCARLIASYDGFIAKFLGDGVLAYFGYPVAHEDAAERAVRAAFEIIAAVAQPQMAPAEPLSVRVGIATGVVVVGELFGTDAAQELVGSTPNLAARLQALAEPGSIVISDATRQLLRGAFKLEDLGAHALKGIDAPVQAWRVHGSANAESRFDAARAPTLSALVGREQECAVLLDRQRLAWSGRGQVILLRGEAGIGKSRLANWVGDNLGNGAHLRLNYQGSPFHTNTAFYPFTAQIQRAAGFAADDSTDQRLEKLEALIGVSGGGNLAFAPLFAAMLSLPIAQRYPPLGLSPTQQRQRTFEALSEQLIIMARPSPVLVVFEDLHWVDPTSIEALDLAVERIRDVPALVLVTCRPEFGDRWDHLDHVTTLALGRIAPRAAQALAEQMAGGRALPPELVSQILAKTDGIPLFVEELTKAVIESGMLESHAGELRLRAPLAQFEVPATLRDSLTARLDRLSPIKRVAQIGAAIGREFGFNIIARVAGLDDPSLRDALARLEDAQLIVSRGSPPDAVYTFKHALLQDVAYESMLRSQRRSLHADLARALQDLSPQIATTEPATLAHHYTRAGDDVAAFEWWSKAGEQAMLRSAYAEAMAHFANALVIADQEGVDPAVKKSHLRIQTAYGQALIHARGWSAPETTAAFARARELAAEIKDSDERFQTSYGLWGGSYVRGELAPMREFSSAFVDDTAERPGSVEYSVAHRAFGATAWFAGDYVTALPHLERALAAYDPTRDKETGLRFGQNVGVSAMIYLAVTLLPLGETERARRMIQEMLALARKSDHIPTVAYAMFHACLFEGMNGTPAAAAPQAELLARLCREHALPVWAAASAVYSGYIQFHSGDHAAGLAEMRRGVGLFRVVGIGVFTPMNNLLLAQATAELEGAEAGIAVLDAAIAETQRTGQAWCDADLYRTRGLLALRQASPDYRAAESDFAEALACAKRQRTPAFEARVHSDMAALGGALRAGTS